MKRALFSTLFGVLILGLGQLSAQKSNIGINLGAALPTGDFADAAGFGFGGDLSYDYYFNDKFDLGVEVGLRSFPADPADGTFNIIPLQLTGAYHQDIDDFMDLYGELGAGAFLYSSKTTVPGMGEVTTNDTYLGLSPRIGAAFELSSTWFLDVNVNYNFILSQDDATGMPNLGYLGLNLGILYTIAEY